SVRLAECDGAAIAREAIEAVQGIAADRGVALAIEGGAEVPVSCDKDRVLQVLSNLLSNAIQVTEAGGRVGVAVLAAEAEAVFTVSDTGPGIPAEDLAHLFERWYRGRRARYPGSGLGLAIARAIVDAHRGRIWADSKEGEGSAFSFALPVPRRAQASATG
ncbi:MAG TPA: HAMP domain-containing sensor histidine kinase, partial [Anaeromyxobacteraceae bacterium]